MSHCSPPERLVAVAGAVELGAVRQGTSVVHRYGLALGWEGHAISRLGGCNSDSSHLAAAATNVADGLPAVRSGQSPPHGCCRSLEHHFRNGILLAERLKYDM